MADKIIILDFGSQYSQLITRKVREHKVFSQLVRYDTKPPAAPDKNLKGIILSGGPSSVHDKDAPRMDKGWLELGLPVLGICYGLQHLTEMSGGKVRRAKNREYGPAILKRNRTSQPGLKTSLLTGIPATSRVWMSHGDSVIKIPPGFTVLASTETLKYAVIADRKRNIYALQFHPEVAHTEYGSRIIANFLFNICGARGNWTPAQFIRAQVTALKTELEDNKVICALSGGVDSSVTAMLLHRAIGRNLHCVFINNGLLRLGEERAVVDSFKKFDLNLRYIDASKLFLKLIVLLFY